jgi:hypothetical protein
VRVEGAVHDKFAVDVLVMTASRPVGAAIVAAVKLFVCEVLGSEKNAHAVRVPVAAPMAMMAPMANMTVHLRREARAVTGQLQLMEVHGVPALQEPKVWLPD